jgi:hypothetical protein
MYASSTMMPGGVKHEAIIITKASGASFFEVSHADGD